MIELKINNKGYHIKTSFAEMKWSEFVAAIYAENTLGRVSVLSGIERDLIEAMPLVRLSEVLNLVSFFDEVESIPILCKPFKTDIVIGQDTYGKFEQAKLLLKKHEGKPMMAGAGIVDIYLNENIGDTPLLDVYQKVSFFLSRLLTL